MTTQQYVLLKGSDSSKAGVKWKLKSSLESWLCWMVFCWGKHVKEHFPEADTGERIFVKAIM